MISNIDVVGDLKARVGPAMDQIPATIVVRNETPPDWRIEIGGACQFFYQQEDGSPAGDYTAVHNQINVPSGSSIVFKSDCSPCCTRRTTTVIFAKVPNEEAHILPPIQEDVGPTHCLQYQEYILAPTSSVPQGELAAAAHSPSLEVRRVVTN